MWISSRIDPHCFRAMDTDLDPQFNADSDLDAGGNRYAEAVLIRNIYRGRFLFR